MGARQLIRNLGSANASVSTPGNIGNETTNAHDERLNTRHRQPDSTTFSPHSNASPASTASTGKSPLARRTRRKRHPRPQQRPYPPTDPWFLITDEDRRSALAHLRGEFNQSAMKKLLLIRANEQKAGYRITRRAQSQSVADHAPNRSARNPISPRPECVTIGKPHRQFGA